MEEPMSNLDIPQTDSIEELARFWDSHDVTDFDAQLEEVGGPVFERQTVVKVPLPIKEAQSLKELAQSKGINDAELIRQWVVERVRGS
jgi:hypothetical protein